MKNAFFRVYAQIDLDAIEYNIEQMEAVLAPDVGIFAVVKTDAYGHGAVRIARHIADNPRIVGFAVATLEEAIVLRESGIKKRILILGYSFPEQYDAVIEYGISVTVFRLDMAQALEEAACSAGKMADIHLALDTAMNRIGLKTDDAGFDEAIRILSLPHLHREGIFTHFAKADAYNKESALIQLEKYRSFVQRLSDAGYTFDLCHCANSAGIIDLPQAQLQAVRAGISLYGVYPSAEVNKRRVPLRPALSLKSTIVHLKTVGAGEQVSYGGTFETTGKTVIATIPVGYGDGYPRQLSNKGYVLIRGRRARILGRVCMDQLMADVTDIPGVSMRDVVTLVGRDGDEEITVDALGDLSGRFSYEFLCDLGKRIPRCYSTHGRQTDAEGHVIF